jgi:hypothetical protein
MSDLVNLIAEQYQIVRVGNGILSTSQHDSLIIWPEENRWWWYSLHIGGGIGDWLNYNNYSEDEKQFYLENADPILFTNNDQRLDHDDFLKTVGRQKYTPYINSRNINKETARYFGLEVINDDIIIPIKNESNIRVGSLIRYANRKPKYKKLYIETPCPFWNIHEFNPEHQTIIFEGAWSVMRFWQVSKEVGISYNLFAGLSFGPTNAQFEYLSGLDNVVWMLDYDTDRHGNLLDRVNKKRMKIKANNQAHRVIINKTMPDEMSDESIKACLGYIN